MKFTLIIATFATLLFSLAAAERTILYCPADEEAHTPNMQQACYDAPCTCWEGRVHCQPRLEMDQNHDELIRQCEATCICEEPITRHTPPPDYCKKTPGKKGKFSGIVDKCKKMMTKEKKKSSSSGGRSRNHRRESLVN